ncbi:hypothetical protein [Mycobacterium malmoense]|nr:hypothetical protein [Mycobacterium malmoense]
MTATTERWDMALATFALAVAAAYVGLHVSVLGYRLVTAPVG